MKIGLEFEGVIRSSKTGGIIRWPQIDEKVRNAIKKIIYERREKIEPIDTYDCLAEVRTKPILNPSPVDLISALYTELELTTVAFRANGYFIQWFEQEISDELHTEIQRIIENPVVRYKVKKETFTITQRGMTDWKNVGNRFRGGGLHINVSPIPRQFAGSFAIGLDQSLAGYRHRYNFKSHYRNNILFRTRYDNAEPIVEYMTFGFNVPTVEGWRDSLAGLASKAWYSPKDNCDHIRWAWALSEFVGNWFKGVEGYQTLLK